MYDASDRIDTSIDGKLYFNLLSNSSPNFGCCDGLLCWLLVRMENSVLGNALEGVPEESEGEEQQPANSKIESADNLDGKYQIFILQKENHVFF